MSQKWVQKTTLSNGIRLITKKIPHVRSISMGVWVNVGARDESQPENGLSHFIEHMLFKGTPTRTAYQIAKEFDAIGGHTNAFTTMETTCYHAKTMDTHLDTMVEILSDIFLNSLFLSEEIENERPVILQEIGMVEDTPEEFAHYLLEKKFWGNHPLGRSIIGNRENVIGFDEKAIKSFFNRFYQPNRIVISAAGNIDHAHFTELIAQNFESIQSGQRLPERTVPTNHPGLSLTSKPLEQVHICIGTKGLSITAPRRFTTSLMNTILGGNMSSRLFQEIREKRGLAYSVYSFSSSNVDSGMFGVYAGVSPANITTSLDLIFHEIEKLRAQHVSIGELKDAMEYTKGNILLSAESTDNQMVRLAQNEIHFDRYIPIEEILAKIDAVTPDDVRQLASDILTPDLMSVTMLGPIPDASAIEALMKSKGASIQ